MKLYSPGCSVLDIEIDQHTLYHHPPLSLELPTFAAHVELCNFENSLLCD